MTCLLLQLGSEPEMAEKPRLCNTGYQHTLDLTDPQAPQKYQYKSHVI